MTSKFWAIHSDPVVLMDAAAFTLLTIQLNLVAGTLAPFAMKEGPGARPDLMELLERMLRFEVS